MDELLIELDDDSLVVDDNDPQWLYPADAAENDYEDAANE